MSDSFKQMLKYQDDFNDSNIAYKNKIKDILIHNEHIIDLLENKELKKDPGIKGEDYYLVNFFPFYLLPDTQTAVKNYICYDTAFQEVARYNNIMKLEQIMFYILCDVTKENMIIPSGDARHDALAALIIDDFNWCTDFGTQFKLVSDRPGVLDNNYVCRTLIFEQTSPNNITRDHRVINSIGR